MIKYTTPAIKLEVESVDITSHDVYVTIEQGSVALTKKNPPMVIQDSNTVITVVLTQEESASFDYQKSASIQVNWITSEGIRTATGIKYIPVMRNLLDEVIAYGD